MSLVIEISEERLQQMLIGASEIGAERAFRRMNKELRFERAKWLTKKQTLEILCISEKQLYILVQIGAITPNDTGRGKVIQYEKKSVTNYLTNPAIWNEAIKLFKTK